MIKTLNAIVYILSITVTFGSCLMIALQEAWKSKNRARLSEKSLGASWPPSFHFCCQNKYSGRQKLYLRINGLSFVKDNGLSLVYIFKKKKVTYLVGQVGDQAWKFGCHRVKAGHIGDPTGRNVEPWSSNKCSRFNPVPSVYLYSLL